MYQMWATPSWGADSDDLMAANDLPVYFPAVDDYEAIDMISDICDCSSGNLHEIETDTNGNFVTIRLVDKW